MCARFGRVEIMSSSNIRRGVPDPVLTIPREGVVDGWPASWWRAVAARVIEDVDGLRVTFQEDARYPDNASPSPPARG